MGSKRKFIANLLQLIPTVGGFVANGTINRRKQTFIAFIACIIQNIVYVLLSAWRGLASCLLFTLKNLYLLIFHKEEKIIIKPIECLIIGIPLLVTGIIGYVIGGALINLLCGIADFVDINIYIIKKEKLRYLIDIIVVIIWGCYMYYISDYVGVMEYIITIIIFVSNIIRLTINRESKYYKTKIEE